MVFTSTSPLQTHRLHLRDSEGRRVGLPPVGPDYRPLGPREETGELGVESPRQK